MKTEIDDMPDKIFFINSGKEIDPSSDINKDDTTEYTITSTVNKQIVEALDKAVEAMDEFNCPGEYGISELEEKLDEIKKQYEASGE